MEPQSNPINMKTIQLQKLIEESKAKNEMRFNPGKLEDIKEGAHSCLNIKGDAEDPINMEEGNGLKAGSMVNIEDLELDINGNSQKFEPGKGCTESVRCNASQESASLNLPRSSSTACSDDSKAENVLINLFEEIEAIGLKHPLSCMGEEEETINCIPDVRGIVGETNYLETSSGIKQSQTKGESANGFGYYMRDTTRKNESVHINANSGLGMRSNVDLKYVPFTRNAEVPIIELCADLEAIGKWKNCAVGYFLNANIPYYVMKEEIIKLWGAKGMLRMACTTKGIYFFEFVDEEARDNVLDNGFIYIFGKTLVLKKWHLMMSLTKEALIKIPIWVKFHNLPYEFWSVENLSKIASIIGRPLYMDQATEFFLRVSYARVCIEVDANEEKIQTIIVSCNDQRVEVEVDYQWYPLRCSVCKVFGHKLVHCPSRVNDSYIIDKRNAAMSTLNQPIHRYGNGGNDYRARDYMGDNKEGIYGQEGWQEGRRNKKRSSHWIPVLKPGKIAATVADSHERMDNVSVTNTFDCLQSEVAKDVVDKLENCKEAEAFNHGYIDEKRKKYAEVIRNKGDKLRLSKGNSELKLKRKEMAGVAATYRDNSKSSAQGAIDYLYSLQKDEFPKVHIDDSREDSEKGNGDGVAKILNNENPDLDKNLFEEFTKGDEDNGTMITPSKMAYRLQITLRIGQRIGSRRP